MHNLNSVTRFVRCVAVGVVAALVSACGGGGGGGSDKSAAGPAAVGGNNAPTLSGSPSANAQVGTPYTVAPTAQDADGDMLAFSIQNLPRWAQFNTATGQLSGTPTAGDVGVYSNIVISVSDGKAQQSLEQFAVKVEGGTAGKGAGPGAGAGADAGKGTGIATVQWQAPKNGADTLTGYRIYYGTEKTMLTKMISVPNAGIFTYMVENLAPGEYFFAITAVYSQGLESQMSNVLSKTI